MVGARRLYQSPREVRPFSDVKEDPLRNVKNKSPQNARFGKRTKICRSEKFRRNLQWKWCQRLTKFFVKIGILRKYLF